MVLSIPGLQKMKDSFSSSFVLIAKKNILVDRMAYSLFHHSVLGQVMFDRYTT